MLTHFRHRCQGVNPGVYLLQRWYPLRHALIDRQTGISRFGRVNVALDTPFSLKSKAVPRYEAVCMCVIDAPSKSVNFLSILVSFGNIKSVPSSFQWINRTTLSLGPAMMPLRIEWLLVGALRIYDIRTRPAFLNRFRTQLNKPLTEAGVIGIIIENNRTLYPQLPQRDESTERVDRRYYFDVHKEAQNPRVLVFTPSSAARMRVSGVSSFPAVIARKSRPTGEKAENRPPTPSGTGSNVPL